MTLKERIISEIIEREGGYVNDPADSGGATKYGITEAVARSNGYAGDMRNLPRALAFDIYAARYWHPCRGDDLEAIAPTVAAEVVDTAVNMGVRRAGEFLQRCLNALNDNAWLYDDLKLDGAIGPRTIAALREYGRRRDVAQLVKALNCLQGAYYIELAERRQKDERFLYGWLSQRVGGV